jgi:hypothetical protein
MLLLRRSDDEYPSTLSTDGLSKRMVPLQYSF